MPRCDRFFVVALDVGAHDLEFMEFMELADLYYGNSGSYGLPVPQLVVAEPARHGHHWRRYPYLS